MNDINFFSSFEKLKKGQTKKSRLIWGAILGVILVMGVFYGFMGYQILDLTKGIQVGENYLNSAEVKTKLPQIQAKKDATQNLIKYDAELEKASKKIVTSNKVSSQFLDAFQKAFPDTVALKNLGINGTQLTLKGNAPSVTTTAELAHNLEATGLFSRVQVSSINTVEGGTYAFDILCELKEVAKQ